MAERPAPTAGEAPTPTERVLRVINTTHGTGWRTVQLLAGGRRGGAHEVHDERLGRAVLKWSPDQSWAQTSATRR